MVTNLGKAQRLGWDKNRVGEFFFLLSSTTLPCKKAQTHTKYTYRCFNQVGSHTRIITVVDASFLQIGVTPSIVSDRLDVLRSNWQGGR